MYIAYFSNPISPPKSGLTAHCNVSRVSTTSAVSKSPIGTQEFPVALLPSCLTKVLILSYLKILHTDYRKSLKKVLRFFFGAINAVYDMIKIMKFVWT